MHLQQRQVNINQAKEQQVRRHRKIQNNLQETAISLSSQANNLNSRQTPQPYDFSQLSTPLIHINKGGEIQVYIYVSRWGETEAATLSNLDVKIELINKELNIVQAWIPYDKLVRAADQEFVMRITPPHYGQKQSGSVLSEGDSILGADAVRLSGISGSGVKVGVISGGADGLAAAQDSGDLPNVTVVQTKSGDAEGTAMLEIVHDLAPNASLGFCGLPGDTSLDFIFCVNELRNGFGADIIVDDIAFLSEPYFEDGTVAKSVKAAVASGVFYTSSAGNSAQQHYEATFLDYNNSGFHNFGAVAGSIDDIDVNFQIPPGKTLNVWLQWNEPFGGSCSDYDL